MVFLVFFHFIPKFFAVGAITCVVPVMVFDAPQAFLLLCKLEREIVDMVVQHGL